MTIDHAADARAADGDTAEAAMVPGPDTSPDARMECTVCWCVYDPAVGDESAGIPPGTAFADLPEDWLCPNCDAPKSDFVPLGDREPKR